MLKGLIDKGHRVTAFVACPNIDEIEKTYSIFPMSQHDVRCYQFPHRSGILAKWQTIQRPYSYMFSDELKQDLAQELTQSYDILHLEDLWSGWLGLGYVKKSIVNIHYLSSIDKPQLSKSWLEHKVREIMTNQAQIRLIKAYPRLITLSDRLANSIQKINPNAQINVIPLGIDLSQYPFESQPNRTNQPPTVGLIGSFGWTPSYTAAKRLLTELWSEIKIRVPNARLQIVGRGAKDILSEFIHLPDVEIYQDVPDILPYFRNLDVMLYAPLVGSGMKVKVMEAFALGVPVVTNFDGIEGLPAEDGVHAGIADDNVGLIDRTVNLLLDSEARQLQSFNARRILEQYCSPEVTISQIEYAYSKLLSN